MNKLLYLGIFLVDDKKESGVINKMKGQVKALKSIGFDVYVTLLDNKNIIIKNTSNEIIGKNPSNPVSRRIFLYNSVKNWIKNNDVDICYIRYAFCDPWFFYLLKQLKKNKTKVIIEIPTYPYIEEMKLWPGLSKYIFIMVDKILTGRISRYVDYIAACTIENRIFNVNVIPFKNCINIDMYKVKEKSTDTENINLLCVTSMQNWQGYDRLIYGLSDYYKKSADKNIYIHMVGDGVMKKEWEDLSNRLELGKYIFFYGAKTGKELDLLFDKCDIAIGGLGIHRKKVKKISSLKTKEYCARGIPFIYAFREEGLEPELDFLELIPSDDKPININTIIKLYKKTKADTGITDAMRNYAIENFTWETQYKEMYREINSSDWG
jgi:glycosyltransferase involved in cell wall biosynthesis